MIKDQCKKLFSKMWMITLSTSVFEIHAKREQKEVSNTNVTIVHGYIYRFVDVKAAPNGNAVYKYKRGET